MSVIPTSGRIKGSRSFSRIKHIQTPHLLTHDCACKKFKANIKLYVPEVRSAVAGKPSLYLTYHQFPNFTLPVSPCNAIPCYSPVNSPTK